MVVESRRPLVVADALHDSEWSGSTSVVNLKLCSMMCAPLMQKGEVFGVIYLGNDNVVSLFDDRALEVLSRGDRQLPWSGERGVQPGQWEQLWSGCQ